MLPIISFTNVCKSINNKSILKDISFDIYENEIFGIIGSSGAGKTTLLRTMIGFYNITKGNINYKNSSITHNIKKIRKVFGFASQENCVYDKLTAMENINYFGKLHQLSNRAIKHNSEKLLKMLELYDSRDILAENLSGGMKRRLDLACALIHNPEILIMDEPTTSLDPVLRKHMINLIKLINESNTTIIISSHLLEDIEHLCSRVGIISKGKLLVAGTPAQLKNMYSRNEEILLETHPGRYNEIIGYLRAMNLPITYYTNKGHVLVIYTPQAEVVLHHILHLLEKMKEKLIDVDVNKPSLNEVFEAFTRQEKDDK
ncbi:ABC transporter ATP-binding protein [Candidatus Woesearchaeota archaeon]|nr:ABC transporter ATP-binding protein [Candidatus Woesearchaeota archaeon]